MIESLKYCIKDKGLILYAYVIMPSHIHLVARHDDGKLNEVNMDMKG